MGRIGSTSWVVDADAIVFVYGVKGDLLGSWEAKGIDKPEGITLSAGNLWIVDNETDRVYLFAGASSTRSGDLNPTIRWLLIDSIENPETLSPTVRSSGDPGVMAKATLTCAPIHRPTFARRGAQ